MRFMGENKMELKTWLKYNKEGMILGALGGLIFSIYLANTGVDLNVALQSTGIADNLLSSVLTVKDVAFTKFALIYIGLGAIIGGYIDSIYKPKK